MQDKNEFKIGRYLSIIFFFTFIGYYSSILLFANFFSLEASKQITVPIRLFIVLTLFLLLFKSFKSIRFFKYQVFFLCFSVVYLLRVLYDYNEDKPYYTSYVVVLGYYLSFAFIPFLILNSISVNRFLIDRIFKAFLLGGFSFSVLCIIFYGKFIGQVSRLSSITADEGTLSPLALSYCSSLTIGALAFYLMHNKVGFLKKYSIIFCILLSFVPFFLGASRGSLVALIISFCFYFIVGKGVKFFLKSLLIVSLIAPLIVFLDSYLDSGLLDRFTSTSEQIDSGGNGAIRIVIWNNAFNQFLENPFFGDGLSVVGWRNYAHNFLIEVLHTTGIIGFIPIVILLGYTFKACYSIGVKDKKLFWVVAVFIQSFVQQLFSGAIYMASWMWASMALVLIVNQYLKNRSYENM